MRVRERRGMAFAEIPVVSFAEWSANGADRAAFAERLRAVCHEVGFFRLVDHGVDPVFLRDYFAALRSFFAMPESDKATIDKVGSPWFRGWERVGAELTDNRVDHREQIDVWTELTPQPRDVDPTYLRLEGPNQWPDDATLPGFRMLVERFQSEMCAIADQLMAAMSLGLGLPADHLDRVFSSAYFHGPALTTSLEPLPLDPRFADAVAASPHHRDAGFMAKRDELLAGAGGTASTSASTYGLQLWNYFTRSYPELMRRHHADITTMN